MREERDRMECALGTNCKHHGVGGREENNDTCADSGNGVCINRHTSVIWVIFRNFDGI